MRVKIAAVIFIICAVVVPGMATADGGVSPATLGRAGWTCFYVPLLGVHCQPRGGSASDAALPLLVFDTSDPAAADAPFEGTELLIGTDVYHGQPCPPEGLEEYTDLSGDGLPYYACHHPKGGESH